METKLEAIKVVNISQGPKTVEASRTNMESVNRSNICVSREPDPWRPYLEHALYSQHKQVNSPLWEVR